MARILKAVALAAAAVVIGGLVLLASSRPPPNEAVHGAVLGPGESVAATNRFGAVTISYVSPVKRKYAWEGGTQVVKMIVRGEPFQGRTGLYDPADRWVFTPGVRLVVQESVMDFASYEQVYARLYEGSAVMDWVYTPDGLVVGFGRSPSRDQINVDVFQFLVQGRKPEGLKGARPLQIHRATAH